MTTYYTATVEQDPNDPLEQVLIIPDEVITELKWLPGDTLIWSISEDDVVSVTKKE